MSNKVINEKRSMLRKLRTHWPRKFSFTDPEDLIHMGKHFKELKRLRDVTLIKGLRNEKEISRSRNKKMRVMLDFHDV